MAACPESAEIVFTLASILHETGQWPEAESRYRQALAIAPRHAAAWFSIGNVLHMLNQEAEATAAWQAAADLGHDGAMKKVATLDLEKSTTPVSLPVSKGATLSRTQTLPRPQPFRARRFLVVALLLLVLAGGGGVVVGSFRLVDWRGGFPGGGGSASRGVAFGFRCFPHGRGQVSG
ncbi:MAG: tetratricopeptide repeat protein [Magnetococcales bacterium]|nr:tetratricopeptide repeat protein [Magnetococcales bacterium]